MIKIKNSFVLNGVYYLDVTNLLTLMLRQLPFEDLFRIFLLRILQLKGYQYIHQINSFFFTIHTYKGSRLAVIVGLLHSISSFPKSTALDHRICFVGV